MSKNRSFTRQIISAPPSPPLALNSQLSTLDFACGFAALRSSAAKKPHLYSTDHQPLAINPLPNPSKTPQKMTVLAGKTAFPTNYFCNRLLTFPVPTAISPFFYRVFVAVLALIFAMKIVPTVGMRFFRPVL